MKFFYPLISCVFILIVCGNQPCFSADVKSHPYNHWMIDVNVGYFYPFSKNLQHTISGGANYQLITSYKWREHWGVFLEGDYFYQNGHSTGDRSKCSLWILPITAGIRANTSLWSSCNGVHRIEGYCVVGPRWNFACTHTNASYMKHRTFANGVGVLGGLGLSYLFRNIAVNAILDFSYGNVHSHHNKKHIENPTTQVGGVLAGGGLGWRF